ncbi:hypothetical protein BMS3Abin04_02172 [bacterium BMS3Abin04]|nr:hypothetical protein BMS3Abin04_02172 [bacterium BMS3Abin04]
MKLNILITILFVLSLLNLSINAQETNKDKELKEKLESVKNKYNNKLLINENLEKDVLDQLNETLRKDLLLIKLNDKDEYENLLYDYLYKFKRYPSYTDKQYARRSEQQRITELEIVVKATTLRYKNADKKSKEKYMTRLKRALNKLFDLKEERRKNQINELEKKLENLKKGLSVRAENKKEIVNQRIKELLNGGNYFNWE